jgi:hypothetical protein
VTPLDRPRIGHQPLYILIFKFKLEILIDVQSSDPIDTKIPLILLLRRQTCCVCAQTAIFFKEHVFKNCKSLHFMFGEGLVSPQRMQKTDCAALWRIFSSNKNVPANRKKGFYRSHLQKNEEIGSICCICGSELKILLKNLKPN